MCSSWAHGRCCGATRAVPVAGKPYPAPTLRYSGQSMLLSQQRDSWSCVRSCRHLSSIPLAPPSASSMLLPSHISHAMAVMPRVLDDSCESMRQTLQTAAGSVLGRMVIALAKRSGVKTINVVRRSAQKQELLDIGCAAILCNQQQSSAFLKLSFQGSPLHCSGQWIACALTNGLYSKHHREGGSCVRHAGPNALLQDQLLLATVSMQ